MKKSFYKRRENLNTKISAFIIIIIAFLLLVSDCCAENSIIGKWIHEVRSKGGLGETLIFKEDGKAIIHFGVLIEGKYKITNDKLIETPIDNKSNQDEPGTEIYSLKFKDNNNIVILNEIDSSRTNCKKEIQMSRIGEPTNNTNPIVGKWSFKAAYKGVMVFRQFIADGRSLFSIPMEEKNGRYKLKDNVLTITEVNKEPYIRNIKIYNNKLILLPTKDNKAETYIRFYKD